MSARTPGPWLRKPTPVGSYIYFPLDGESEMQRSRIVVADLIQNEADARLIAAAPELLAALQWAADRLDVLAGRGHASMADSKQAREAIAKATQS